MSTVQFYHPHLSVVVRKDVIIARVTVAYLVDGDTLEFGVSFCSPRDNFCRRVGREIALSRMRTIPMKIQLPGLEKLGFPEIKDLLNFVIENKSVSGTPLSYRSVYVFEDSPFVMGGSL